MQVGKVTSQHIKPCDIKARYLFLSTSMSTSFSVMSSDAGNFIPSYSCRYIEKESKEDGKKDIIFSTFIKILGFLQGMRFN